MNKLLFLYMEGLEKFEPIFLSLSNSNHMSFDDDLIRMERLMNYLEDRFIKIQSQHGNN